MSNRKEDIQISAIDFRNPIIDQLIAETGQSDHAAPQSQSSEADNNILLEIKDCLSRSLALCNAELARRDSLPSFSRRTDQATAIASNLAADLTEVQRLLYAFSDDSGIDLYKTLRYIKAHAKYRNNSVTVRYTGTDMFVYMPYLPGRGQGNNALVNQMLAAEILTLTKLPSWPKWQAAFYHVFPSNAIEIPRDVENYDYKKTIDLLAYAVRSSDSALNFSMKMDTVFTDCTQTGVYIHIFEKSSETPDFGNWRTV